MDGKKLSQFKQLSTLYYVFSMLMTQTIQVLINFFPFVPFQSLRSKLLLVFLCIVTTGVFQARIAQLVAYRLGTGEAPGSNPGKGEKFSVIMVM